MIFKNVLVVRAYYFYIFATCMGNTYLNKKQTRWRRDWWPQFYIKYPHNQSTKLLEREELEGIIEKKLILNEIWKWHSFWFIYFLSKQHSF